MMTQLYPNILISSLQLDESETVLLMSFVTRVHTDDEYITSPVFQEIEKRAKRRGLVQFVFIWLLGSALGSADIARASLSVTWILFKFRRPPLNERNRAECNAILPTSRFSRVEL